MFNEMLAMGGNSGGNSFRGSLVPTSSWQYLDCGFNPKEVVYWCVYANTVLIYDYDVENNKVYRWYQNDAKSDVTSSILNTYVKVDGTKIYFTTTGTAGFGTVEIMAI